MKNNNKLKFKELAKKIKKAKNILLLSHVASDGDAIGSLLAMNLFLKKQKKNTYIYSKDSPKFLNFLPGYEKIKRKIPNIEFDLVIALDYSSEERIAIPQEFKIPLKKTITIDHHFNGKRIGELRIIDKDASSTCEMLYFLFKELKFKINKDLATIILAGILTDTVGFSRTNQNFEKVEKIIGDLLLSGAKLFKIMEAYNHFDFNKAKAVEKLLERVKKDEKLNLIYSYFLFSDFKDLKINFTEPPVFPDFLAKVGDANFYAFLTEQKNGKIKISLRSCIKEDSKIAKKVNLARLSEKFGGGGHKVAAGFKIKGTIDSALNRFKKELRKEIK